MLPLKDASPEPPDPSQRLCLGRILDANANRATEGLRVVEDYCRFVLDDLHLTRLVKQLRHDLAQILSELPAELFPAARETQQDVGTQVSTAAEQLRAGPEQVAIASQKRIEQALRCLEEFAKPAWPQLSPQIEQLRYRAYTLARSITITRQATERLRTTRLYVLIDGGSSLEACLRDAQRLLDCGVQALQLRVSRLTDRALAERARHLATITRAAQALLIINDRADIARLVGADGVHVGQDDLSVKDARSIVGCDLLLGVSTHDIDQARQAVLDGASYIGCGPTFPSETKSFTEFAGLSFLEQVAAEIRLPAFAIGGIQASNLDQVRTAGFTRIAVSGAVAGPGDPAPRVAELLEKLGC